MLQIIVGVGLCVAILGLAFLMVRGVVDMWRDKERSGSISKGIAGALAEVDRAVRPSAEHVHEAKEPTAKRQQDDSRGE